MRDDRALPRDGRLAVDAVGAQGGALVDHDDLHVDALAAEALGLLGDGLRLVQEHAGRRCSPAGRAPEWSSRWRR